MAEKYIFHLISEEEWNSVEGEYRPDSLKEEGFIHFCEENQIETILKFNNKSKEELLVLCVPKEEVKESLKYENKFPHLYKPLDTDIVSNVKDVSQLV